MDMSSLSSGLPRPADDPINIAFKEAALSITHLYKASQASRREGYLDALDDIWKLFFQSATTEADVDITRLATWLNEQRRNETTGSVTTDDLDINDFAEQATSEIIRDSSSNRQSSPRHSRPRLSSPAQRRDERSSASTNTRTNNTSHQDRRERTSVKRRVIGTPLDSHKRRH